MKKSKKKLLIIGCALLPILFIAIYIIIWEIQHPIIENVFCGQEGAEYDGYLLDRDYFFITDLNEFEYIGRESNHEYNHIYVAKENNVPVLLMAVERDNTYYYIHPNYKIPTSGEITKVYVEPISQVQSEKTLHSSKDIKMIKRLISLDGDEKLYNIDNFSTCGNRFYLTYNNCPVSIQDNIGGYIAYTEGKYIFANPNNIENMTDDENGASCHAVTISGIEITDKELLKWLPDSILTDYIEE